MTVSSLSFYECGYCTHSKKIIYSKGSYQQMKFPATVALIKHDKIGYILFDTGYASHFFEATKSFPYSAYAKITPVYFSEEKSIKRQLEKDGIDRSQIKYIILSHFHGDHTAGLKDFPEAKILSFNKAYQNISTKSKFHAITKGCLHDLLPDDLEARISFIDKMIELQLDKSYGEFTIGFDIFNDNSLIATDLTGHAIGQFGIFVNLKSGKRVFLVADAVWISDTYEKLVYPHWLANIIIEDKKSYRRNVERLNDLHTRYPEIDIVPTHCYRTGEKVKRGIIYE
ncbi:MBL fold metallo-hydrolase [Metabacillus malikii]|uniref:Glyoxylase-like metal-dependent hydrolase (Beta-lactamase superfamily II) n=1 Tax=Metabacillus malikii TaxID=1504265 RepID=A0ABT9ZJU9_9BACI|nr:MBL fold metallo-hydrolase [Metabacillus malikii]MDQ0232572.1 glyoxylase-like metal-dependent hydrolase (beta-lactamase superfamily II) [Metabacillus malikii]